MGTCESLFLSNREKSKYKNPYEYNNQANLKNIGPNFYCAPIDSSPNNDNIYVNDVSMSQTTMTMDMSQYNDYQKPQIYQYINKYKTNGLQNSVVKASLVELGNQGNSLVYSNIKNSKINSQTNSLYTSKCDDTGYDSSYDGFEMIIDGKMDEELVQKSTDKNTINNYNEFIKKKDNNNNNNNTKNPKIMDYYKKNLNNNNTNNNINKNLDIILEEKNKEEDELSRIPSSEDLQKLKINGNINKNVNNKKNIINIKNINNTKKNNNNNIKNNMQRYIQSMGKY